MKTDDNQNPITADRRQRLFKPLSLFSALVLSGELSVLADVLLALFGIAVPVWVFMILWVGLTALLFYLFRKSLPVLHRLACGITAAGIIALLTLGLIWRNFSASSAYEEADSGKSSVYAGRNVMVIVPHQDDDINFFGGVLEQYVRYGSTVRVVFTTAGDNAGYGETRMQEALQVLASSGVPEENVIFLGYGDGWDNLNSIYYLPDDEVRASYIGRTETYGLPEHPAYNDGAAYTRANYLQDLIRLLTQYRPDTVFCTDFDYHMDHRTTSILFDEAMGKVLSADASYTPEVYKGYAYETAHYAEDDFYSAENLRATQNPSETEYLSVTNIFAWSNRIRFPVAADMLSRSVYTAPLYAKMKLYASQYYAPLAGAVINSDRVFWRRETGSLLYSSSVSATSGRTDRLTDFMLYASDDRARYLGQPYDGMWIPDASDTEKSATFTLSDSADLTRIVLYDNCSLEDNILDALIIFPDGSSLHTGPLDKGGAGTCVTADKKDINTFTVQILESEGASAGLSEVEAYTEPEAFPSAWLKLMNANGDFAYDYWLQSEPEAFSLYTYGTDLTLADLTVTCDNPACSATANGDQLLISCPRGKSATVTVCSADGSLSDSIRISNPGMILRLGWQLEAFAYRHFAEIQQCATYSILRAVYHTLWNVETI